MTRKEALYILGLQEKASLDEIKKRYRKMMLIAHPDVIELQKTGAMGMDATDINLAYECLMKNQEQAVASEKSFSKTNSVMRWNAPVNPSAYRERDIFHQVEDADGAVIGETILDTGKYYWTEDEEFSLFLKSLYYCGKEIINTYIQEQNVDISTQEEMRILPEIVYLLSQQYVDSQMVLSAYANVIANGEIYQIDAMLEGSGLDGRTSLKEGTTLYPAALRNHKLYVCNEKGRELGYISFKDDRLYYGVIPLFERKAVQVKMQIRGNHMKRMKSKCYREVDLMVKMKAEDVNALMESVSTKIELLLQLC